MDCIITDPPYGVSYVGKTADALVITGDDRDLGALRTLLTDAFTAAATITAPGAAVYVAAPPGPTSVLFGQVMLDLGWLRQTLVWVKDVFVLGHSDYHYRHEMIFYGYVPGAPGRRGRGGIGWYGDNSQDSILDVPRPKRSTEHPTMKPTDLITPGLRNSTAPGDLVLDPFAGSGSTMVACHLEGRVARMLELDPRYADVICRRWQQLTGDLPVDAATGDSVDFTEEA